MDLNGMFSEVSQTKNNKCYMFLFTCGIQKIKQKQSHRYKLVIISEKMIGGKIQEGN